MNLANDVLFTCSGYGIAAQALTAVVRAHDGRGPQTALTYSILRALSLSSPDELIGYLFLIDLLILNAVMNSSNHFGIFLSSSDHFCANI